MLNNMEFIKIIDLLNVIDTEQASEEFEYSLLMSNKSFVNDEKRAFNNIRNKVRTQKYWFKVPKVVCQCVKKDSAFVYLDLKHSSYVGFESDEQIAMFKLKYL